MWYLSFSVVVRSFDGGMSVPSVPLGYFRKFLSHLRVWQPVSLQGESPCQATLRACLFHSPTLIITSIVLLSLPLGMFWSFSV